MRQGANSHNKQHQRICFHLRVEGLVLHLLCLPFRWHADGFPNGLQHIVSQRYMCKTRPIFSKYIGVYVVRIIHLPYEQSHHFGSAFFLSVIRKSISLGGSAQRCRKRCRVSHWESYFVCCLIGKQTIQRFPTPLSLGAQITLAQLRKERNAKGGGRFGYEAKVLFPQQTASIYSLAIGKWKAWYCILFVVIQVADRDSFFSSHTIATSHNPEFIHPDEAFPSTSTNSSSNGWVRQWDKAVFHNAQHQYVLFPLESRGRGPELLFVSHSGGRHTQLSN